jgi:hypothetical protein
MLRRLPPDEFRGLCHAGACPRFDINDFDETHPGPFEWDVKRLAVSFVLAARWLGLSDRDARQSLQALLAAYRTTQAQFADLSVLETWYARITFEDLLLGRPLCQHVKQLELLEQKGIVQINPERSARFISWLHTNIRRYP